MLEDDLELKSVYDETCAFIFLLSYIPLYWRDNYLASRSSYFLQMRFSFFIKVIIKNMHYIFDVLNKELFEISALDT